MKKQRQSDGPNLARSRRQRHEALQRPKPMEGRFEQRERHAAEMLEAREEEERRQLHLVDRQAERLRHELDAMRSREAVENDHDSETARILDTEIERAVEKVRAVKSRVRRAAPPRGKTLTKIVVDVALEVQENVASLMRSVGLTS